MSHPFERIFEKALKKTTPDDNHVHEEASKLLEKGYAESEICTVLEKLEKALIDDTDRAYVREARQELCEGDEEDED